jgi:hypothetical protein
MKLTFNQKQLIAFGILALVLTGAIALMAINGIIHFDTY